MHGNSPGQGGPAKGKAQQWGNSSKTTPLNERQGWDWPSLLRHSASVHGAEGEAGLEARHPETVAGRQSQTSHFTALSLRLFISKVRITISISWVIVKTVRHTVCKRCWCLGFNVLYKCRTSLLFLSMVPSISKSPNWSHVGNC